MIGKGTVLAGLVLFLSIGVAAQGPYGVGSGRPVAPGAVAAKWQIAVGYQYNLVDLTGNTFNTNGVNASVTRYFGDWFGLEAQVGLGIANTASTTDPANLTAKSLFAGGGPRFAYRGHGSLEPWVHVLAGMEKFRFSQTAGILGNNTSPGLIGGAGIDMHLNPHTAIRVGVDALGTFFFNTEQAHFQAVAGLSFDF